MTDARPGATCWLSHEDWNLVIAALDEHLTTAEKAADPDPTVVADCQRVLTKLRAPFAVEMMSLWPY